MSWDRAVMGHFKGSLAPGRSTSYSRCHPHPGWRAQRTVRPRPGSPWNLTQGPVRLTQCSPPLGLGPQRESQHPPKPAPAPSWRHPAARPAGDRGTARGIPWRAFKRLPAQGQYLFSSYAGMVHHCLWPLTFQPLHPYLRNVLPWSWGTTPAVICPGLLPLPWPFPGRELEAPGRAHRMQARHLRWPCATCFPMTKPWLPCQL